MQRCISVYVERNRKFFRKVGFGSKALARFLRISAKPDDESRRNFIVDFRFFTTKTRRHEEGIFSVQRIADSVINFECLVLSF